MITAAIGIPAVVLAAMSPAAGHAATAWQTRIVETPLLGGPAWSPAVEHGLQVKTVLAGRVISAHFPQITEIGGVRPDGMHWHPEGLAIDVMIPDWASTAGRELGDRVVAYAFQNAKRFGLVHVIWQRTYYPAGGSPRRMADLGSPDANHYTHVHIATDGGGFSGSDGVLIR